MATLTSTACHQSASGFFLKPPKYLDTGVVGRSVVYTVPAGLSSGDIIRMVPVPNGAVILELNVNYAGLGGASITTTVGDGATANRYNTSISSNVAPIVRAVGGLGYSYSVEDTIDIVVGTVTSTSTGVSLILNVMYQMDAGTGS